MTPRIVRAFVIVALQRYFANHPEYPWKKDRSETQIFIQPDMAEDVRERDINPSIIVESSGHRYGNDAIGNVAHATQYKEAYVEQTYQFLVEGSISVHCLAESDDAAEELGFEIAIFLQSLRPTVAEILQVQTWSMPQQSKPQLIQHDTWAGHYDSIVSVGYSFAIRRKHTPIDKGVLLTEINSYLDLDNPTLQPGTGETGGTSTGGQNGNWGGTGGINGGDGVDDGIIQLKFTVTNTEITGEQS